MKGLPRLATTMPWGGEIGNVVVYVDSDFAACRVTRKSTSGGAIVWGQGLMKAWAKTQPTIALSTGEAELGAVVKGVTEAEGVKAILADFGIECSIVLRSDATAAIGIVQRLGLGKVRHLAVSDLWVQEKLRSRELSVEKVDGLRNPSDLLTKNMDGPRIRMLTKMLKVQVPSNSGNVCNENHMPEGDICCLIEEDTTERKGSVCDQEGESLARNFCNFSFLENFGVSGIVWFCYSRALSEEPRRRPYGRGGVQGAEVIVRV